MKIGDYCTGIQHIGLPTADMDGTLRFYSKIGFKPIFNTLNDGYQVYFLQLGDLIIETYEAENCAGKTGAIDHISLNVKNIDELFDQVRMEGYKIENKEIDYLPFFENGVRFFTIVGPNSEKVEFNQIC